MRPLASLLLLLPALQPAPCSHDDRGSYTPVRLDDVEGAYRDAARAVTSPLPGVRSGEPLDEPFDAGLPRCAARRVRRVVVETLPEEARGLALMFGPRPREGTVHVLTAAPRLRDAIGAVLASPELAARFGVACAPSRVRLVGTSEVEIHEGD